MVAAVVGSLGPELGSLLPWLLVDWQPPTSIVPGSPDFEFASEKTQEKSVGYGHVQIGVREPPPPRICFAPGWVDNLPCEIARPACMGAVP